MWFWNKKHTITASGILVGATDHHSHILPGVDDGVETMDEALRILDSYEALGIKELWLTPHIMEDIPNTPKKLTARFNELKAAYTGNITLHLAAEYMIDNNLHKLIQKIDSPSLPRGAVQSKPFQETPPLFRGEVVEDRRGEKSPKEHPLGTTEESKTTSNKLCHALEGLVQPEAFQETPPRLRGEVVEDQRGEKSPKEYPLGTTEGSNTTSTKLLHSLEGRWHELSEVTEGNQTNNCPSYIRGASDAVAEGVETNSLLPIGSAGKHILVETSYFTPPMRLHETLRKIKSLGYHPILAHPERYMYMEKEEYFELHEEGIKFQLNLASLAGGYGKAVKKKAEWLLKKELYSIAGSDLHCEDAIEFITGCRLGKKEMETLKIILKNTI